MRRREILGFSFAAAGWPTIAAAQDMLDRSSRSRRLAILHPALTPTEMSETGDADMAAFFVELRRQGYVEGWNFTVDRLSGEGRAERIGDIAREAVRTRPDIILAITTRVVIEVSALGHSIPIVGYMGDPVAFGLLSNLAKPGANLTGVATDAGIEVWSKRLQILSEIVPNLTRVAFLSARTSWDSSVGHAIRAAAQQTGIAFLGPPLDSPIGPPEYERVITEMSDQHAQGVVVFNNSENLKYRREILSLVEKKHLPTIYPYREHVILGGLVSYGVNRAADFRALAGYVGRVLSGESPGDMPILQPANYELVINLKSAAALGLTISPNLAARADEVIE